MTIQQWLFSFKGRIGRRDFWIWMATWIVAMLLLFFVAFNAWLSTQTAAFALVCLMWPTAAVVVKRLHDRGRSGAWAFLIILAWMLVAGNWSILPSILPWVVGRLLPTIIFVMMVVDLGAFIGTQSENKYGKDTLEVKYR